LNNGGFLPDGVLEPACAQSCASRALIFGDLDDRQSTVSRLSESPRGQKLLGELGTEPSVTYLQKADWSGVTDR
jgi:molybdopterin-containing oxidoreductase family iron-sulfur binding subunit